MSPHPRPILKRVTSSTKQTNQASQPLPFATCARILSPHVHFPPTPSMVASTHPVHSPQTYDRKPIIVSPNYCALPERGDHFHSPPLDFEVERGRGRSRQTDNSEHIKGSYFHPRAYEACELEPAVDVVDHSPLSPPMLVRDMSNSDEYDSAEDDDDDDSDYEEAVTTPPDTKIAAAAVSIADPSSRPSRFLREENVKGGVPEDRGRPMLVRRPTKRPSIRFASSILDEGCLGGF